MLIHCHIFFITFSQTLDSALPLSTSSQPSCHYEKLALWYSINSDPVEKIILRCSGSAYTRRRAWSSCLAGKNTVVTVAVRLLADVGVGQALFASHMFGVRHHQGWKDGGDCENETHFVGRGGWLKKGGLEGVGWEGWSKRLVEKVGCKGWSNRLVESFVELKKRFRGLLLGDTYTSNSLKDSLPFPWHHGPHSNAPTCIIHMPLDTWQNSMSYSGSKDFAVCAEISWPRIGICNTKARSRILTLWWVQQIRPKLPL